MGQKFDIRKFGDYDQLINGKSSEFNIMINTLKMINRFYLNNYYIYERVANEVKPDLFFCDYIDESCYDIAWKLKKPAVTFVGVLPR